MFSSRIRLKVLSRLCRNLATLLAAGVPIVKAIQTVARKTQDSYCRKILEEVANDLRQGSDLSTALSSKDGYFPELFVDLMTIAEETGNMPEVLDSVANHYDQMLDMKRDFISAITPALLQFFVAVIVVAGLIFILGMITSPETGKPNDTLGWGLVGAEGAITFLSWIFGILLALWFTYQFIVRGLGMQRSMHSILLMIPVIGSCMRSFAIARFSWAFYLTQQAGMKIQPSLAYSLKATSNGAFQGATGFVTAAINAGEDLSTVLAGTRLFPEDFIDIVSVAEASGTVPEALERLSPRFEDQARRSLRLLAATIQWLVWIVVATFIVIVIFSIIFKYIGMIQQLNQDALR